MQTAEIDFETSLSVPECATTFQQAIKASCGPARRLSRVVSVLRGAGSGEVEFFEPRDTPTTGLEEKPAWKAGAFVPGFDTWRGVSRAAIHVHVFDLGDVRAVHLAGPYGMGGRGSTMRLLRSVRARF